MAPKIVVEILADADKFSKELKKAGGHVEGLGKVAGVAGLALAGGLAVGLKSATSAAMDAQKVNAQTESQLKALGISYGAHAKQIDKSIQATSKLAAIDDEDLQTSFNALVRTTGNVTKALKDTALAANISRGANISLEAGQKAVMQAELGRVTGLKKLGISVATVTTAQDKARLKIAAYRVEHKHLTAEETAMLKTWGDDAKATDKAAMARDGLSQATQKFSGAAEAYGKTAQGAQDRMRVSIENLQESIGKLLLPVVEKLSSALAIGADFMEKHTTITKILMGAVAVLAGVLLAASVATKVMAAGQVLLNIAMSANPIGLVVLAIAGLVIGLAEAWRHSETFRKIVTAAFDAVKGAAMFAFNWVKDNWPLILGIITGPVGLAVVMVVKHWDAIRDSARNLIGNIADFFKSLPGRIGDAIGGAMGALKDKLGELFSWKKIVGWIKDALGFGSPSPHFMAIGADMIDSMIRGVGGAAHLLKDAVGKLAKQFIPSFSAPKGGGDASGSGPMASTTGLVGRVLNALQYARRMGWHGSVISGFRTYQEQAALYQRYVNSGFNPQYIAAKPGTSSHERGEAVDVSDASRFDSIMAGAPRDSQLYNNVPGDFNHFSVSGYDRGGWLPPGLTLALNKTGKPEMVIPAGAGQTGNGGDLHIHFDGPVYADDRGIAELTDKVHSALLRKQRSMVTLGLT